MEKPAKKKTSKNHFYVVTRGRKTGIFTSCDEAKKSVQGFKKSSMKGFHSREEAEFFMLLGFDEQKGTCDFVASLRELKCDIDRLRKQLEKITMRMAPSEHSLTQQPEEEAEDTSLPGEEAGKTSLKEEDDEKL